MYLIINKFILKLFFLYSIYLYTVPEIAFFNLLFIYRYEIIYEQN